MILLRKMNKKWTIVPLATTLSMLAHYQLVHAEETSTINNHPTNIVNHTIDETKQLETDVKIDATLKNEKDLEDKKNDDITSQNDTLTNDSLTATSLNQNVSKPLNPQSIDDTETLKQLATPIISSTNESKKVIAAISENDRQVVSQPILPFTYSVKYSEKNKLYYLDAIEFGLDLEDGKDDTQAVLSVLSAANEVVMKDSNGNHYKGVAVKLSGIVNIEREKGEISHYELRTFNGNGIPYIISNGKIDGVKNTATITPEEFEKMTITDDGLTTYTKPNGQIEDAIVLPIYKQVGKFNQIKIDKSLLNVTALFGEGIGATTIKSSLVQLGTPWNSDDNDTESRDHAAILVENQNGFLIKDLTVAFDNLKDSFGMKQDGFYYRGMPYYGKVNGIQIDDSNNVLVDSVEVFGANKAGIFVTSSYNTVAKELEDDSLAKKLYGNKPRSLNYLVQKGNVGVDFSHFNINKHNKILNSHLHHNRVAGIQFGFQTHFLVEGNTLVKNGHHLNGSTGYGVASSAGTYNDYYIYRQNKSMKNYRKGFDAHEGNHILIEKNVSYGDRLLGISVYNRSYKMEHAIIKNNVIVQDVNNRLQQNDLRRDGRFAVGSDYAQYEAIHLQTNEKALDLSDIGSVGYFEISGNTIMNLNNDGNIKVVYPSGYKSTETYTTNAILVRMQEPYLDYVLNIENNNISGDSATTIFKIINSAIDHQINKPQLVDTTKFSTGLGYGSGTIHIANNIVNINTIKGSAATSLSPIYIAETTHNKLIKDNTSKIYTYQDKFRGSLTFNHNQITVKETKLSSERNSEAAIRFISNAEAIIMNGNKLNFGDVSQSYTANIATVKPLIQIDGITGPTAQPKANGINVNTLKSVSNLPSTLRYSQPFVFINNDITMNKATFSPKATIELPVRVLTSNSVVRYIYHNTFSSKNVIHVSDVKELSDVEGNTVYHQTTIVPVTPNKALNDRLYNLSTKRFNTNSPELVSITQKNNVKQIMYVLDETLPANELLIESEGKDGLKEITVYKIIVDNNYFDKQGDIDVYSPLPQAIKNHFYELKNLTKDSENKRVNGLVRGDYITKEGNPLTLSKTFDYNTSLKDKNGQVILDKTHVVYHYMHMPMMLDNGTEKFISSEKVIQSASPKILRIGTRHVTYIPIIETEKIAYTIDYIDTNDLEEQTFEIVVQGIDGSITKIYRELKDINADLMMSNKEFVSETIKQPVNAIIKRGTRPKTHIEQIVSYEEVPFKITYQLTNKLNKGEQHLFKQGEVGLIEHRIEIVLDSKGNILSRKLLSSKTIKDVTNEIILIGTKEHEPTQHDQSKDTKQDIKTTQIMNKLPKTGTTHSIATLMIGIINVLIAVVMKRKKNK